ncbi:monovalent cation/H+ antiporter complex subunit F [Halococcus hamelinensis]|uniref:Monovalent cation/H+ antiporter subunit F n=1 Tax=Halococcus hamelinensis 100A6 TaxID=1132509 RepID=M0MBP8_9EURY|nr:monovalent cation/H+ antiporter complex subunit F [Halococcus hamelinensis]EMA42049.1 monovalent cation/H+ antiporter subunit F [Halococcus hamelinensis 100A6]
MTSELVSTGLLIGASVLVGLAMSLFRRITIGPTTADRIVAANVIGTATVVVIALLSAALDEPGFLDVALVYALLNFLLSLGFARFSIGRGEVL